MRSKVLWIFIIVIFGSNHLVSQAPPWQWAKEANSGAPEQALDVCYDSFSGNIYAGGVFNGNLSSVYGPSFLATAGLSDGFLTKYDPQGNVLWAIKIGGTDQEEVRSVATDPSGNVYVAGHFKNVCDFDPSAGSYTLGSSGGQDGFLAKYDALGNLIWATKFGNASNESINRLFADANGIYLTGSYTSNATFYSAAPSAITKATAVTQGMQEFFGAKYNSSGVVQWVVSAASQKNDEGYDVVADNNYVYFIGTYEKDMDVYNASGSFTTQLQVANNNNTSAFLLSYHQVSGAMSWVTNIGSPTNNQDAYGYAITQDNANLYVSGSFDGTIYFPISSSLFSKASSGNNDMFLAKLSKSNGVFQWVSAQTCTGNGDESGFEAELDASGNIIVAGYFNSPITFTAGPSFATSGGEDVLLSSYTSSGTLLWASTAGANGRDLPYGLATGTSGAVYVAGEHADAAVFGLISLSNAGGSNIFVAKTGCEAASNNTLAASQTICVSSVPASLSGSLPIGGTFFYSWQQSANNTTWTAAAGTSTNQNYSPPALVSTTYYRRSVIAGTGCTNPSFSNTVSIVVNPQPSAANAGSSQTICVSTGSLSLNGNVPAVGTGTWSVLSGTATIIVPSLPNSQVIGLAAGTHTFKWSIGNPGCTASTATVNVIVNALPTPALAGTSQTLCINDPTTILNANVPVVGAGTWSVLSGGGSISNPTLSSSGVTSLLPGTTVLQWKIVNGVCAPSTSTLSIQVDNLPTTPVAGVNQTVCISSPTAQLNGNTPLSGTGTWSLTGGAGTIASPVSATTAVTGLALGTNTLNWKIKNGVCPALSSTMTIQVDDLPTVSLAGPSQTICIGTPTTVLNGNIAIVGVGSWSVLSGSGSIITSTLSSSGVTSLATGTNVLQWKILNGVCAASTSTMSIQVDNLPTPPVAGVNQTVCISSPTAQLNGNTPLSGTGTWSLIGGMGAIVSPISASTSVGGLALGTNTLSWKIKNGVCPALSSTMTIQVDNLPTVSLAGPSQTICIGTPTTVLNGNIAIVGVGSWSVLSGVGAISNSTLPTSGVTSLNSGTIILQWKISNGVCAPSTSTLSIQVDNLPTTPVAGVNQTVCISTPTAQLNGNAPVSGTGTWSLIGGTGTIASSASATTSVTGLALGTNTLSWKIKNGVCPALSSTLTIQVDNLPTPALAGASQTVCISTPTTILSGNTPAVGIGTWSVLSGSGSIITSTLSSSGVTSLATGTNVLQWKILNGVCAASTSTLSIQVDNLPTPPVAGPSQTVCISTPTAQLNGNAALSGTGTWSVIGGTGTIASSASATTSVTGLALGTNTLSWTIKNGVCPAVSSTLTIQVDDLPTPALAGASQTLCINDPTTALNGNLPTVGIGTWSVLSGSGTIVTPALPFTGITGLASGTNVLQWSILNGACAASTSTLSIQVDNLATIPVAGASQTVCISTPTAQLNGNAPLSGAGSWSLIGGSATIVSPVSATTSVTSLVLGANTFAWSIQNGVCPVLTSTTIVQADDLPTPSLAGPSQTICISSPSMAISGNAPAVGIGTWSVLSGGGSVISPTLPLTGITGLNTGTTVLQWKIANGVCAPSTSTMSIQVDNLPTTPVAGVSQTVCISTSTAQLNGNAPVSGTGTWSLITGAGIIASPASATTSVAGLVLGTNTFEWSVLNGVCPVLTSTTSVQVDDLPDVALAGPNQTLCINNPSTALSANSPIVGYGSWSFLSGNGSLGNSSSFSSLLFSLGAGQHILQWEISNGVCAPNASTLSVQVDDMPSASFAGNNQVLCTGFATLTAAQPSTGTGAWSVSVGSASPASVISPTTQVAGLSNGPNIFVWTVSNGSCPVSSQAVTIMRDSLPTIAYAGRDTVFCSATATLQANIPVTGTGSWEIAAGNGNIASMGSGAAIISGLNTGINSFVWIIANGSCPPSSDTVHLTVDALPTPASAGPDQRVCTSSVNLAANSAAFGAGHWEIVSGSVRLSDSTTRNAVAVLADTGIHVLRWVIRHGTCPESYDEVLIRKDASPGLVYAGYDQLVEIPELRLAASVPTIGIGSWSVVVGSGILSDPLDPSATLRSLSIGDNLLRWTVKNGVCDAISDDVVIHLNPLQIPSGFSPNGDGINDTYVVPGLDYYEGAELSVFNRWGALVYYNAFYKNEWGGTNRNNDMLADDTYFYTLKISKEMSYSGYVIIKTTK
jgi:gliding motility-associated-like protein